MVRNMKEFTRRLSMMEKTIQIKQELKILLPEIEFDKIMFMLSHLSNYTLDKEQYYTRDTRKKIRKLKPLTEAEKLLLDYLLKNKLNPKTTYRWFLVSKLPEDIQERLRRGVISVSEARKVSTNRLLQRDSNTGLIMLEEITNIVRSL